MSARSNTEIAIAELRRRIFNGALVPGENYLESELAELLGMSRTPLREAALIVQGQGLIEVQPRRGIKIAPVDVGELADIHEILTELECLAVRRAAQAGYTKADLAAIFAALDGMDVALKARDRFAWSDHDDAFHRELCRLSQNAHLLQCVQHHHDQIRRAQYLMLHLREAPQRSTDDHRALADLILRGEPEQAADLHREHCVLSRAAMLGLLETMVGGDPES